MYNFLKFHDVSVGMYVILIIVLLITHHCIWKSPKYIQSFKDYYLNQCYSKCNGHCGTWSMLKDDDYYPPTWEVAGAIERDCLLSGWEISHFLLHTIIGYFYNFQTHITLSVGYEVYEKYSKNCSSLGDIFINFAGFTVGSYLRHGKLL